MTRDELEDQSFALKNLFNGEYVNLTEFLEYDQVASILQNV